jgi:hypothetical protein
MCVQVTLVRWEQHYVLCEARLLAGDAKWNHFMWLKENFAFYEAYIQGWIRAGHDQGHSSAQKLIASSHREHVDMWH